MARAIATLLLLMCSSASVAEINTNRARINYMLNCQGCHLPDGSGKPGAVPDLKDFGRFLAVPGGREYLVRVPGSAQSPLSDADLAALLNWMLRRFGPAEVAASLEPYTAEEISAVRRPPLADVAATRARLLARLRAGD